MLKAEEISQLAVFYRSHLLNDVMPFWEERTQDEEYGGFLNCFDRQGGLTDTDKYIWMQGRQLWMFSVLYNRIEKRESWLALARQGRDFLVRHAYAGHGRWYYHLSRDGQQVKQGTISIYSDLFMLAGLCEYALANDSLREDLPLIEETFAAAARNFNDPNFKDLFHGVWSPERKQHGPFMIALNTFVVAGQVLGKDRVKKYIDECLKQILSVFAKDQYRLLFESVGRDDAFMDTDAGRLVNPGHGLESMGFSMEAGEEYGNRTVIDRSVTVADWLYQAGYDQQYGGLISFLDAGKGEPPVTDWHRETQTDHRDKVWWVHAEALYTLCLIATETGSELWFNRFKDLHDWCQAHFYDREYKEWYSALSQDGTVKDSAKGSCWKAAYHLPRALMKITLRLDNWNAKLKK